MISQWWSLALTAIGVTGYWLMVRKYTAGLFIGAGVQLLWMTYAVATVQWPFIASALVYGAANVDGIRQWRVESNKEV